MHKHLTGEVLTKAYQQALKSDKPIESLRKLQARLEQFRDRTVTRSFELGMRVVERNYDYNTSAKTVADRTLAMERTEKIDRRTERAKHNALFHGRVFQMADTIPATIEALKAAGPK